MLALVIRLRVKLVVFACFLFLVRSQCANILGIFPLKFKSHYIVFDALMTELARRGHNVTVVNPFPKTDAESLANYTDIDCSSCYELPDLFALDTAYEYHNTIKQIPLFTSRVLQYESIIECEIVKNFKRTTTTTSSNHYDLVITELFNSDVMLGFAHELQVPFVSFCAGPLFPWGAERTGNPDNPAYVPYVHTDVYFDRPRPTFYQRLYNTILYSMAKGYYSYYSYFGANSIAKKLFGPHLPPLNEIAKNTSLILSFAHFSVNRPRPLVPNIVEVAGLQITDTKPLPKTRSGAIFTNSGNGNWKARNTWTTHLHSVSKSSEIENVLPRYDERSTVSCFRITVYETLF